MNTSMSGTVDARETFDRLLGTLRPKLHRYCALMTGSVIDGEDVVQEALAKAIEAFPETGTIVHPEDWLFRIAHNAALDFLRRRARQDAARTDGDPDMTIDPVAVAEERQIAATSLRTFMRLPVAQRSSVILMDVLGYSLQEICAIMDSAFVSWRRSLRTFLFPFWRNPSARCWPGTSTVSTRATSTPYATCLPLRCGLSLSTSFGCAATAKSEVIVITMPA